LNEPTKDQVIPVRYGTVTLFFVVVDHEGRVEVRPIGDLTAAPSSHPTFTPPTSIRVRTLGGEQIWVEGKDVASVLVSKPIKRFIFYYLLSRELARPGDHVLRATLADEVYPGVEPEQQRTSVRQHLFWLRQLPFGSCVRADAGCAWLDLSDCDVDAHRLLALARRVDEIDAPLPDDLLVEIEAALRESSDDYLPEWESLEDSITGGRGNAGAVVASVRSRLESAQVTLMTALADSSRDRERIARAIPYLERGLSRFPTQEEIARRLSVAYGRTGRARAAARLRADYGLGKAS
jgi:transcriptional activator